jgi:hypothetical protein
MKINIKQDSPNHHYCTLNVIIFSNNGPPKKTRESHKYRDDHC